MKLRTALLAIALLGAFTACGHGHAAAPQAATAEPEIPESELAPHPFTADQIRDATKIGRTYVWRIETVGQPPVLRRTAFTGVSAERATMISQMLDEQGTAIGPEEPAETSWAALVKHASYPKNETVISEAEVDVPAGKFACKLYTITEIREGHTTITTVYFPIAFPGAPVKMDVVTDGVSVRKLLLLEHKPGT